MLRRFFDGMHGSACLLLIFLLLSACTTFDRSERAATDPSYEARALRWQVNEVPYEEARTDEKIGRNVRDGFIGFIDSYLQGGYSVMVLATQTGFFTQKATTFVGDLIGLIDDNDISEHVFKGIVSRQFLRFGSRAKGMPKAIQGIHEARWELPDTEVADYIGDRPFHHRAYIEPSGLATLGAVILGDGLVRPAGHLVIFFGARRTGEKIDEVGKDLIGNSFKIKFI